MAEPAVADGTAADADDDEFAATVALLQRRHGSESRGDAAVGIGATRGLGTEAPEGCAEGISLAFTGGLGWSWFSEFLRSD